MLEDMEQEENQTGADLTLYFCMKGHKSPEGQNTAFERHIENGRKQIRSEKRDWCQKYGQGEQA